MAVNSQYKLAIFVLQFVDFDKQFIDQSDTLFNCPLNSIIFLLIHHFKRKFIQVKNSEESFSSKEPYLRCGICFIQDAAQTNRDKKNMTDHNSFLLNGEEEEDLAMMENQEENDDDMSNVWDEEETPFSKGDDVFLNSRVDSSEDIVIESGVVVDMDEVENVSEDLFYERDITPFNSTNANNISEKNKALYVNHPIYNKNATALDDGVKLPPQPLGPTFTTTAIQPSNTMSPTTATTIPTTTNHITRFAYTTPTMAPSSPQYILVPAHHVQNQTCSSPVVGVTQQTSLIQQQQPHTQPPQHHSQQFVQQHPQQAVQKTQPIVTTTTTALSQTPSSPQQIAISQQQQTQHNPNHQVQQVSQQQQQYTTYQQVQSQPHVIYTIPTQFPQQSFVTSNGQHVILQSSSPPIIQQTSNGQFIQYIPQQYTAQPAFSIVPQTACIPTSGGLVYVQNVATAPTHAVMQPSIMQYQYSPTTNQQHPIIVSPTTQNTQTVFVNVPKPHIQEHVDIVSNSTNISASSAENCGDPFEKLLESFD